MTRFPSSPLDCEHCGGIRVVKAGAWVCASCGSRLPLGRQPVWTKEQRAFLDGPTDRRIAECEAARDLEDAEVQAQEHLREGGRRW